MLSDDDGAFLISTLSRHVPQHHHYYYTQTKAVHQQEIVAADVARCSITPLTYTLCSDPPTLRYLFSSSTYVALMIAHYSFF